MRVGLFTIATDQNMAFHSLAQEAEQRGFDILFTGEHTHIPVGAQVWSGGDMPRIYRHILDPFISLGAASAVTTRIKLGIAISLLAIHDPIHFAKMTSTIDFMSQGRLELGLGYGYIPVEFENHGVAFKERKDVFRDKMRAVRKVWTEDVAAYEGPYASFKDVEQFPKPFNGRQPTVLLGAKLRDETIRDMVEFCDGWLPTAMMGGGNLSNDIARFKREWSEKGRDLETVELTVFHTAKTGAERQTNDWGAAGLTDAIIESYEQAGVKRLCVPLAPAGSRDEILHTLDGYAGMLAKYISA